MLCLLQTIYRRPLPLGSCKQLQCNMGKHDSSRYSAELFYGSMVLDLLVETSQRKIDEEVEDPSHQDVASPTCSISKMAAGTSSGINSEEHECPPGHAPSANDGNELGSSGEELAIENLPSLAVEKVSPNTMPSNADAEEPAPDLMDKILPAVLPTFGEWDFVV